MSATSTQKKEYDLTTGGIVSKLLLVALPIMGTQLMQMAYNLTDMFWLGRVSSEVVAASGTAGNYLWLSQAFLLIGRMGAEIGVSQHMGKGDAKGARRFAQNAFSLSLFLGILFGLAVVLFSVQLIGFFRIQEANVARDAVLYLRITGAAIPATFLTGAIAGAFNGSGNSRTPFFINAIGLVFNMILDPLMISYWGWGIGGAAIATALAQLIVTVLSIIAIHRPETSPFSRFHFFVKPNREVLEQIFRWSIPIGMESLLFTLLSMIISRFVAAWGTDAIAVQRVSTQVESLTWLISGGFSTAVTAFVGQNYGAGKWARIRKGNRIAFSAMCGWGVVTTTLLTLAGGTLFSLFLPEPHLVSMGASFLAILAISQIPLTLEAVSAGVFRGIGRTLPPSLVSIAGNVLRVPVAYLLSLTALGLDGLWYGVTIGAMLRGLWIFLWYLVMMRHQPFDDISLQTEG